ncbi:MAG TPA: MerR family transcriptional regulator [Blastocatellia bacterium]
MYRIGEFSALSQVSIKTLRYYDEIGLLRPARTDRRTGYRYYSPDQLTALNRILVFKDLGFSLDQIGRLLKENLSADDLRDMLQLKRAELEERVERERAQLLQVETRLRQIEEGKAPAYEVALKRVEARLVASLRDTIHDYSEADALFDELCWHLKKHAITGNRAAVWHNCEGNDRAIDCEAVVLLKDPIPETNRIKVYQLPADLMACLVHAGEEEFPQAYVAARSWIASGNYSITGPNREIYLQPSSHSTPGVTEIQFPIISSSIVRPNHSH